MATPKSLETPDSSLQRPTPTDIRSPIPKGRNSNTKTRSEGELKLYKGAVDIEEARSGDYISTMDNESQALLRKFRADRAKKEREQKDNGRRLELCKECRNPLELNGFCKICAERDAQKRAEFKKAKEQNRRKCENWLNNIEKA
ncbi:hypothetical protein B7494_g7850 [Chlorociboria aeruginascens]|nr:hypothetical protein B7494_g7850 [Chlorociboria aeruginascens]